MSKTTTETSTESNSITLKKDAKGNYGWEIKIYGEKVEDILTKLRDADRQLQSTHGAEVK